MTDRALGGGSLTEYAYAELRRQIVTLKLPPGARFSELQLTKTLAVGKTPVREALARLVEHRLVATLPRVGYLVAPITLQDVHQICELRLVVEPEAARLAVGRADAQLLRDLDDRCVQALGEADDDYAFTAANHAFHLAIAAASGNSRLVTVVDHLLDESDRLYRVALLLGSEGMRDAHRHLDLVRSIEMGDARSAVSIMSRQLREFRSVVIDALMVTPSILSVPVGKSATEEISATLGESRARPAPGMDHREELVVGRRSGKA